MGVLSRQRIRGLLDGDPPLVSGFEDAEEQLQPNGFDMTLESVAEFAGAGKIGASNADRVLAETRDLPFDADGRIPLGPGVYAARLNETVAIPPDVMALARPRSSILRNGAAIHNAVWDAGYVGRSQVQIVVSNPHGIVLERNARILQMVFFALDEVTDAPYAGLFQGEGARVHVWGNVGAAGLEARR